ncbi:MAG TPA: N-acetylmuramoyl-L-alanine amidase [Solirubrobacteraceae bacterium]|nr:N-acetylmuramoyl-L-alanine amidase [Solirubrobacteraceae bacterium]
MHHSRLNRREALGLGVAAAAAGALRPRPAYARGPALFELAVDDAAAQASGAGWRTTRVQRAPRRFDLMGLRWAHGSRLEAHVRVRRRGGDWSRWIALHAAGDHRPDSAAAPPGTEPAWTGTADLFQLRLRGPSRGLRARFVRAQPTARTARALTGRLRRRARARTTQVSPPRIITRTEWGGDTVPPRSDPRFGQVQLAFVHHTVTAHDYAPEESAGIVLGICRYHRDSNRWNDIGYNFLVDKYGQVFEGRAGGLGLAVVGAQAQGYNSNSTGIACLGTFSAVAQSEPGMDALARLIGWKLSVHGVPTQGTVVVASAGGPSNRYPTGAPVTLERISGHRDGDQTSCPGDVLYGQLADLRERSARYAGPLAGVTVRAAARRVRTKPVVLSGELRFPDGASPAGAPLDIQFSVPGAAWQRVAGAACGPDGRWQATVALARSGLVRAAFTGDGTRPALESPPVSITVLPALTLSVARRRIRAGAALRVSGTLAPAPLGGRIELRFERQVGRRWIGVQRKRINVRGGRFDTRVRPHRPGLYRVTAITPGATRRVQVRAVSTTAGAATD